MKTWLWILVFGPCIAPPAETQPLLVGSVAGIVRDPSGAAVAGADVRIVNVGNAESQHALTSADGHFSSPVAAGPFQLTINAPGFAKFIITGSVVPGQVNNVPQITLTLASENTSVEVTAGRRDIAAEELRAEEQQRLLGLIPNYYVTYLPNAEPLDSKQKFELASKFTVDPTSFVITGIIAGIQQANNSYSGYGRGAAGYGKRYAAAYGNFLSGIFIGNAILPAVLKQDPRYFYKGTGTTRSRIIYALANAVVRKGDNGRWQPNYSDIIGGLAAGGVSNLYYPAKDRNGAALTFQNAGLDIVGSAAGNLFQEFFARKLTRTGGRGRGGSAKP